MIKKNLNINSSVVFEIVKLINQDSKFVGFFKKKDCIKKSKLIKTDLVEFGSKNNISICKFINYNKFKYLESKKYSIIKKNKFYKKNNNKVFKKKKIKEIKLHLFTAENDYNNKLKHVKKFLNNGLKVKITLIAKGREIFKVNIINEIKNKIIDNASSFGKLSNKPDISNKFIFMYFDPKKC